MRFSFFRFSKSFYYCFFLIILVGTPPSQIIGTYPHFVQRYPLQIWFAHSGCEQNENLSLPISEEEVSNCSIISDQVLSLRSFTENLFLLTINVDSLWHGNIDFYSICPEHGFRGERMLEERLSDGKDEKKDFIFNFFDLEKPVSPPKNNFKRSDIVFIRFQDM